jgi:DDE superfamily endonuclease
VLFGDNAYTNSAYMVTPFKGNQVGTDEDNFNFFHSQLRIQVECAFGQLVHRWGILRRPIPQGFGISKTCVMVLALAKLHNFCINRRVPVFQPLATDDAYILYASSGINTGGVFEVDNNHGSTGTANAASTTTEHNVEGLVHGGEHYEDVTWNVRRQVRRRATCQMIQRDMQTTPQKRLLHHVIDKGLQRPTPKHWKQ